MAIYCGWLQTGKLMKVVHCLDIHKFKSRCDNITENLFRIFFGSAHQAYPETSPGVPEPPLHRCEAWWTMVDLGISWPPWGSPPWLSPFLRAGPLVASIAWTAPRTRSNASSRRRNLRLNKVWVWNPMESHGIPNLSQPLGIPNL